MDERAKRALQRFVARLNTVAAAQNDNELASWAAQRHESLFGYNVKAENRYQLIVG